MKADNIIDLPNSFVQVWKYIKHIFMRVVDKHCLVNHPQMRSAMKTTSKIVVLSSKNKFLKRVRELIEGEKNREHLESYRNTVSGELEAFLKQLGDNHSYLDTYKLGSIVSIQHLSIVEEQQIDMAFELNLKIRMH